MAWDRGDWLNLAGAFAKEDQLDKRAKIKERGEQLAELNKLYMTIATQRYATDEAIWRKEEDIYRSKQKMLNAIGTNPQTRDSIAMALAKFDMTPAAFADLETTTDDNRRQAIIESYYNHIEEVPSTEEGGVAKWKVSGRYNPEPIRPEFGNKYYDMAVYPDKLDKITDSTRGTWTKFLMGEEVDKGGEVLAKLQKELQSGSKKINDVLSEYNIGKDYLWDAADDIADDKKISEEELLASGGDIYLHYFNMLPINETQRKEWMEDGVDGNNWVVDQDMVNNFMTESLSETAQNEVALDILKTIPDSEGKSWKMVEGGKTSFAPGAETTKGLILAGYKDFVMGEVLTAISTGEYKDPGSGQTIYGDTRPFVILDRNKKLARWFNDNKVALSNLAYPGFGGGKVNAMYVIPSPVRGNNNPQVLEKIRGELIKLVNINLAKDSTLQETIRAEFNKNGIPMPQARKLTTDSNFQSWVPYLDAWANHRLESFKTAKIPSVTITDEKAEEFDMQHIFSGMQSKTEILSLDDITKENVGLMIESKGILDFWSWDAIHNSLQESKADNEEAYQSMLDLIFSDKRGDGFNNDANSYFLDSYPLIVDYFKLDTKTEIETTTTSSSSRPSYVRVEGDKVIVKVDGEEKAYSPGDIIEQKINNLPIYKIHTVGNITGGSYGNSSSIRAGNKLDTINELNDNNLLTDEFITLFNEKGINPEKEVSYPVTDIQYFKEEPTFSTGYGKHWKLKDSITTTSGNTYKAETYDYTKPNSSYSQKAVRFVLVEPEVVEPEAEPTKVPTTTDDEFISGIQSAIESSER